MRIEILDGLKRKVWLTWNPRVLRIRTAMDKVRQVLVHDDLCESLPALYHFKFAQGLVSDRWKSLGVTDK